MAALSTIHDVTCCVAVWWHLVDLTTEPLLPHFEFSVKFRNFFYTHIDLFEEEEKNILTLFSDFFLPFWVKSIASCWKLKIQKRRPQLCGFVENTKWKFKKKIRKKNKKKYPKYQSVLKFSSFGDKRRRFYVQKTHLVCVSFALFTFLL
jgi:hypothetical protein